MADFLHLPVPYPSYMKLDDKDHWFKTRFHRANGWQREIVENFGYQAMTKRDRNVASMPVRTPICIMPNGDRSENWEIVVTDWDKYEKKWDFVVPPVPVMELCLCKFYSLRYGTVEARLWDTYPDREVVYQYTGERALVTSFKRGLTYYDMGELLHRRFAMRVKAVQASVKAGVVEEVFYSQAFCEGNHGIDYYLNFCWDCRGSKAGTIGVQAQRNCDCDIDYPLHSLSETFLADEFSSGI